MSFHWVASRRQCRFEVMACDFRLAVAKRKFSKRSVIEGVMSKAIEVLNGMNLLQPAIRTVTLSDGNGPIKRDDW